MADLNLAEQIVQSLALPAGQVGTDATRGLEVPPEAVREYVKSWKQQGSVYGVLEKISKLVSTRNRESASFMNVIASLDGSDTGAKHEKYFIKALTCMGYFVEYDQLTATQVDDEYDEESWQLAQFLDLHWDRQYQVPQVRRTAMLQVATDLHQLYYDTKNSLVNDFKQDELPKTKNGKATNHFLWASEILMKALIAITDHATYVDADAGTLAVYGGCIALDMAGFKAGVNAQLASIKAKIINANANQASVEAKEMLAAAKAEREKALKMLEDAANATRGGGKKTSQRSEPYATTYTTTKGKGKASAGHPMEVFRNAGGVAMCDKWLQEKDKKNFVCPNVEKYGSCKFSHGALPEGRTWLGGSLKANCLAYCKARGIPESDCHVEEV